MLFVQNYLFRYEPIPLEVEFMVRKHLGMSASEFDCESLKRIKDFYKLTQKYEEQEKLFWIELYKKILGGK